MKAIVKKPSEPAEVIDVQDFEAMQTLVGGYLEMVRLDDMALWCDEDGKLKGLAPNVQIGPHQIVGTLLVTAIENDQETSLTDDQVAEVKSWLL